MNIWHENYDLNQLNALSQHTMAEHLDMKFVEIGGNYLVMSMPVDHRTHQPYGLLHGGASAALAETVGSVASSMCIDHKSQSCLGLEINCNHIRGVRTGLIYAKALNVHKGKSTHIWDIRIHDDHNQLICISRLTVAVIDKVLLK